MGGSDLAKELADSRKKVQKASLKDLNEGSLLKDALNQLDANHSEEVALDVLSLLQVLARKLRTILGDSPIGSHDLIHSKLGPAMRPTGSVAILLLGSLESSQKPRPARAADCLSALARMTEVLLPPSTGSSTYNGILTPLFEYGCRSELVAKRDLVVVNTLLPCVKSTALAEDLAVKIRSQMGMIDAASLRGSILCKVLVDLYNTTAGNGQANTDVVTQMIMPMFEMDDTAVLTNASRYLLPDLFKAIPRLPLSLVERLQPTPSRRHDTPDDPVYGHLPDGNLPAWIAVASLCVSTNLLALSDLSIDTLTSAMEHASTTVRIDTLRLLISSRELLRPSTLELVKGSITLCSTLPDAYARSEFTATIGSLLKSLKTAKSLLRCSKDEATAVELLLAWILEQFVDPGLGGALRYPVVKTVLALNVLSTYVVEFDSDLDAHRRIFTRARIDDLLACQACNFAEVRSKARTILAAARVPLPGYESFESSAAQALIVSALTSISHPRKTQAEAGKAVLCILFERLAKQPDSGEPCREFVIRLVDDLETRLRSAETDLVDGITNSPLHGVISAIAGVLNCTLLSNDSQQLWKPLLVRIVSLVDRLWTVTSKVVSLLSNVSSERRDHEIARAYEVMSADMDADGDTMDHTNLLSGCWRATTEAAELLAEVTCLPLIQLGTAQEIWSVSDIDRSGHRFLTWLHEIRHRGTFSKVATSFGKVVSAVHSVDLLRPMCREWLEVELDTIATKSFSTTRRSAALPYSLLALVVADGSLQDIAVNRLMDIARVNNEASDDVTRVHAFNILRIILLDTRTSRNLDRFFEKVIIMALEAFSSANWNVRNVGLILFSSLVNRSMGSSDGTQDYFQSRQHLSKRQTLHSWASKYPSIIPFLRKELRGAAQTREGGHGALFPILIILRSLRWSSNDAGLAEAISPEVKPFLDSREWQVRLIAAQALSSLVSPEFAIRTLVKCSQVYLGLETNNARHGHLLFWRHLVTDVISPSDLTHDFGAIPTGIMTLLSGVDHRRTPAPIIKSILDVATSIQVAVEVNVKDIDEQSLVVARRCLQEGATGSGADMLADTASRLLATSEDGLEFLLRQGSSETQKQVAVEHLCASALCPNAVILQSLIGLVISDRTNSTLLVAGLQTLTSAPWSDTAADSFSEQTWSSLCARACHIVKTTENVPLREASLPALGWAVVHALGQRSAIPAADTIDDLLRAIDRASEEDQSKPSRLSAVYAIERVRRWLYPNGDMRSPMAPEVLLGFHRLILRLSQDDDHEIRELARILICDGLALQTPTCLERAIELEWQWIGTKIQGYYAMEASHFLWDRFLDRPGFEQDIAALHPARHQTEILFEVEPPNQWRDPLIDSHCAGRELAALDLQTADEDFSRNWRKNLAQLDLLYQRPEMSLAQPATVTPIDQAWEARRNLHQRKAIHSMISTMQRG